MVIKNNRPIEYRLNYKAGGKTKIVFIGGGHTLKITDLLNEEDILKSSDLKNGWISIISESKEEEIVSIKDTALSKAKKQVEIFSGELEDKKVKNNKQPKEIK
jgi:Mor family transcriptional regulator